MSETIRHIAYAVQNAAGKWYGFIQDNREDGECVWCDITKPPASPYDTEAEAIAAARALLESVVFEDVVESDYRSGVARVVGMDEGDEAEIAAGEAEWERARGAA